MKKQKFEIKKVHLESFMDFLMEAYMEGAVYVDLVFSPGKKQDHIKIVINDGYEEKEKIVPPLPLTDDTINALT